MPVARLRGQTSILSLLSGGSGRREMQLLTPTDKGQKLDSSRAFSFLWTNWRIGGMHPTRRWRSLYYIYATLTSLLSAVGLPASLMFNLYFIDGLEQLIGNLYLNVTITVATAKYFTLIFYREMLLRVNEPLEKLDARCNDHPDDRRHVLYAVRLCRLFFVTYMSLYSIVAGGFAYIGFSKRQLVYNGWFPRLLADPDENLLLALTYQNWAILSFFIFQNCNNDVYPQSYIVMMIGHLRALAGRIERIGKDHTRTADDNVCELLECVQDHKNILNFFDCVRPAISRTITLQFVVTAFVLCLTAINVIVFEVDLAQLLFTATYLIAVLVEVFPCCWFVNALLEEDRKLTTAMYSCNWYEQSRPFRRILIIFMQRSQKPNLITAGNLAPVTLQTFLAIIRFSFSMFTLLSKMSIKSSP